MRKQIVSAFLLGVAWLDARAQSSLPLCPNSPTEVVAFWTRWANCFGKFRFVDVEYEGNFKGEVHSGQGTIKYDDGEKYVGEFKEFDRHGKGALISDKGHTIVEGEWLDNSTVTVLADTWRLVGSSDSARILVLPKSIKQDGALRRTWLMIALYSPNPVHGWLSVRRLEKFDCANERHQQVTATAFSGAFGSGKTLDSFDEEEWSYVQPGTIFSTVMGYVCDHKLTHKK